MNDKHIYITLMLLLLAVCSCKKDFLEAKPSSGILTPNTLSELEGLLENTDVMNKCTPALSQMASDDYIFTNYENWSAANTATERNSYIWAKDIHGGANVVSDWASGYKGIFYCNNVLEILPRIAITPSNTLQYNTIKGWALFMRAYVLYDLVRNFCPAYDAGTASSDMGVPVPLEARVDKIVMRSSVKDTYGQILNDLMLSSRFLDTRTPVNNNRPCRAAAWALFSRIYLSMREYGKAELYADSTLALNSKLIDYNTVSKTATSPFSINNEETIFSTGAIFQDYVITIPSSGNTAVTVNPELISLYDQNDLRITAFFRLNAATGNLYVRRGYFFQSTPFTGLATDEMYLIKAECLARRNNAEEALSWLNALLKNRFAPENFKPVAGVAQDALLQRILTERRKELVWRTLRWTDLKRLNKEGANITLKRVMNGATYTLPPNDPRYVFPIPDDEVALSGIQQNIR
ncbi:SusD family protein [Pedobacter westerhofensis]|uniref:SusD family protein n=1 Tax=Pedobacter westerhofensis TaxID=425512 RepID=A0A521C805_9SPHI|nr:RagB/SusD family nutrient uptake outer membrane protein [Pedobacter westerhofensis]SMO55617.1 SusD family protein [Pedobacter westerhofensis]